MTIKTYDIGRTLGEDLDGTNLARRRAREVESAFQDFFGIDVDLVSRMTAVPAHWFDIESDEVAINVTLSPDAQAFTWSGLWFMSIQEQLADYFGPSSGSSNITTEVVEHDLTVRQVILLLSEGDDLKKATRRAEEVREETDPSAFFLVALALFNYSLGWDAEKILDASGDFNKGNTAQDEGGIDGYWLGTRTQVKPGSHVTSAGRATLMEKEIPHAGYVWNHRSHELWVATLDDYLGMVDDLTEVLGADNKTHLHDCDSLASDDERLDGRRFRYIWY